MRHLTVFLLGCVGLISIGIATSRSDPQGAAFPSVFQIPAPAATGNETLLMHAGMTPTGTQQMVVIDSAKRVMAVYHIASDTGAIQLKSVRNLAFDFQLEEFNGQTRLPPRSGTF